jgi:hypothetical protein
VCWMTGCGGSTIIPSGSWSLAPSDRAIKEMTIKARIPGCGVQPHVHGRHRARSPPLTFVVDLIATVPAPGLRPPHPPLHCWLCMASHARRTLGGACQRRRGRRIAAAPLLSPGSALPPAPALLAMHGQPRAANGRRGVPEAACRIGAAPLLSPGS